MNTAAATDAHARELERLRRENDRLRQALEERAKQISDQMKQIEDLKRQLALRPQNSTATSKPPSSDGLAGRPRGRGRRVTSRRKPGGQPGHPGHHRPLVPAEGVQAIVDLVPDACRHCAYSLRRRDTVGDAPPSSHRAATEHHGVSVPSAAVRRLRDGSVPSRVEKRSGTTLLRNDC